MKPIKGTKKTGETITGTDGDDHIVALGGNDTIYGGDGNDHINAGAGDDHVTGGKGNDLLHGNGGADVFHYSFVVTQGGGGGVTVPFTGFDDGADDELSQTEFSHQYDAWLASLGADMNDDDVIDVVNNGGSSTLDPTVEGFDGTFAAKDSVTVHVGKDNTQTRYYSASATTAGGGGGDTVASTDGHDTIADFHVGLDSLSLGGLTSTQFLALFEMDDSADVNDDGVYDTVISISGDTSFSITLLGVNGYELEDFYGA